MTFTILVPAVKFGIAAIAVHDIVISFITRYISLIQQSAVDLGGPRKVFCSCASRNKRHILQPSKGMVTIKL